MAWIQSASSAVQVAAISSPARRVGIESVTVAGERSNLEAIGSLRGADVDVARGRSAIRRAGRTLRRAKAVEPLRLHHDSMAIGEAPMPADIEQRDLPAA